MKKFTEPAHDQQRHLNVQLPAPGTYAIDVRRSKVTFTVGHFFGLGRVSGHLRLRSGEVVVAGSDGALQVCAVLAADSFETGNPGRDMTVRGRRLLDAARFPDLRFSGTSPDWDEGGWQLGGLLRVRETDSPVALTVAEYRMSGQTLHVLATAEVDRVIAGVDRLRGLAGRRLHVRLDVWAGRVPTTGQVLS